MAQDVDHNKKLKDIEERQNKYFARRVEEQDVDNMGRSTAQSAAEERSDETPESAVDYICYECAPLEEECDELATGCLHHSPAAQVSKGVKAELSPGGPFKTELSPGGGQ